MRTTVLMILVLAGSLAAPHALLAQAAGGSTNRYGGGERYGGAGAGARYGGGTSRTTPAATTQPGRTGGTATTGRGVAPAPLTRGGAGQTGQMGRTPQAAPVAAPVPPAAPPIVVPSDAVHFSELPAESKFYFVADANRSFLWVKTSDTVASNTVNQKVANIPATSYVRAEAGAVGRPATRERTADELSVDRAYESRYGIKNRRMADSTNAAPPTAK